LIQMKLSLTFCVTNGKDKYYFSNIQAGIVDMQPNVRRYVHVGAESRWRVFLHSWCDAEL